MTWLSAAMARATGAATWPVTPVIAMARPVSATGRAYGSAGLVGAVTAALVAAVPTLGEVPRGQHEQPGARIEVPRLACVHG